MTAATKTTFGPVSGFEKDGVVQFRGIPFAAPPVGPARWRPPQPPEPWSARRECTTYGPLAPQNPSPLETMLGSGSRPSGEDCLSLNVVTPACDDRGRAVLVWLHGGGFTAGSGSIPWYNGVRLATAGDVVVVTINYRLGALGYLHLPALLGDEFAGSGNCGLLDQIAALEWVRDNIAGFGGDPDRVTVFGESAGAMSIGVLLGTPASAGLFCGAIAQSGAAHHVLPAETAAWVTEEFVGELGVGLGNADAVLDASVEALLAAQLAVVARLTTATPPVGRVPWGTLTLPFQPVVDGAVVEGPPLDAIRGGSAATTALLAGCTTEEWNLFHLTERQAQEMTAAALVARCERLLAPVHGDGAGAEAVETYRRARPGMALDDVWVAIATDVVFRIPAIRLVEAQAAHQPDCYMYLFSYRSTAWGGLLGSFHAIDVPFAFDNLHRSGVELMVGPVGDAAHRVAAVTSGAWLSFARSRSPGHEGLPGWPAYDPGRRATMELGPEPRLHDDPGAAEREIWAGVL